MENKKRKMFAAVAVIMLCAVAIVGVGYAYTATTLNQGNTATSEYVTLTQTGDGAYKFANNIRVYYDTANTTNASTTKYTLSTETGQVPSTSTVTGMTVVKLGNTITLNASNVNRATADLTCKIITSGFATNNEWTFFIVVNNGTSTITMKSGSTADNWIIGDAAQTNEPTFTIPSLTLNSSATASIDVYYGYVTPTSGETPVSAPTHAPLNVPLNNATITFSATTTPA